MSSLDAFTVKTHAELARLVDEAKSARRAIDHRACPDAGACRHCQAISNAHMLIDDHLCQLDEAHDPQPVTPVSTTPARECGVCGRTRYSNFSGAVICMACDGTPDSDDVWSSMGMTEDAE